MNLTKDTVTNSVIARMVQRQEEGQRKYLTTLGDNPRHFTDPDQWLIDLQEELLDAIQYIEKYRMDRRNLQYKLVALLHDNNVPITAALMEELTSIIKAVPYTPYKDNPHV